MVTHENVDFRNSALDSLINLELEFILEEIVLCRLRGSDAAAFKKIRLQALLEHPEAFGASWEDENGQPESLVAERLESGHVIAGISADGTIVGTIGIRHSKGQKTQHIAAIWGMYVSPVARGSGLGRRLLDAAIAQVEPSVKSVRLSVEANNAPAIKLYEAAGFKRWALEVEALKVGDVFRDEVLMRLDIR
ncbi:N-acetyltransferase family protein [Agrobacterium cavarae]